MDMFDELYKIVDNFLYKRVSYDSWVALGEIFQVSSIGGLLDIVFIQLVDKEPIYLNSQKIRVV